MAKRTKRKEKICAYVGCGLPAKSRGLCAKHYQKWWSSNARQVQQDRAMAGLTPEQRRIVEGKTVEAADRDEQAMATFDEALDQLFDVCLDLNRSTKEEALKEMREHYVLDTLRELDILKEKE